MPVVTVAADTSLPPEQVIAALTDFSPDRVRLFANLDADRYELHDLGPGHAEVTEGSSFAGGVWERSRYTWSASRVRIDVLDSNTFAAGSSWEYVVTPVGDGAHVALTVRRVPASLRGRLLAVPLRLFGRRVFRADLEKTLAALVTSRR